MDESRGKSINVNLKLELQYGERNCFLEAKLSNKNGQRKWLYYPGRLQTEYQKRITKIRIPIQCLWHDLSGRGDLLFYPETKTTDQHYKRTVSGCGGKVQHECSKCREEYKDNN